MKLTKCMLCGRQIAISSEISYGQHIRCPYCEGTFAYLGPGTEFSEERMAYALTECLKRPEDNRYYFNAPCGARMYIAMIFYAKVFKEGLDTNVYIKALIGVEAHLEIADLRYLLCYEEDPELRKHFRKLIERGLVREECIDADADSDEKVELKSGPQMAEEELYGSEIKAEKLDSCVFEGLTTRAVRESDRVNVQTRGLQTIFRKIVTLLCCVAVVSLIFRVVYHYREVCDDDLKRKILEDSSSKDSVKIDKQEGILRPNWLPHRQVLTQKNTNLLVWAEKGATERKPCEQKVIIEVQSSLEKVEDKKHGKQEEIRERFSQAYMTFADGDLAFWEDLRIGERPCMMKGRWYCALPNEDFSNILYMINRDDAGRLDVQRLSPDAEACAVSYTNLETEIMSHGAVYSGDSGVVVRGFGSRGGVLVDMPTADEMLVVGQKAFGKMLLCMKALGVNYGNVKFSIQLVQTAGKEIKVADVGIEDEISRELFEESAKQYLMEKKRAMIGTQNVNLRRPRVSVIEYDGAVIRKRANGVVEVPRKFVFEAGVLDGKKRRKMERSREEWNRLKEVAAKQATETIEYEEKLKNIIAEKRQQVVVSNHEIDLFVKSSHASYTRIVASDQGRTNRRAMILQNSLSNSDEMSLRWSGDCVPDAIIRYFNERLAVKEFCGIPFGVVDSTVDTHKGRAGVLPTKFRVFEEYSCWGTELHRVNKVDLRAELKGLDNLCAKKELGEVVSVLQKDFGVSFRNVNGEKERSSQKEYSDCVQYIAETDKYKIEVTGWFGLKSRITVSFINYEVDDQDVVLIKNREKVLIFHH